MGTLVRLRPHHVRDVAVAFVFDGPAHDTWFSGSIAIEFGARLRAPTADEIKRCALLVSVFPLDVADFDGRGQPVLVAVNPFGDARASSHNDSVRAVVLNRKTETATVREVRDHLEDQGSSQDEHLQIVDEQGKLFLVGRGCERRMESRRDGVIEL